MFIIAQTIVDCWTYALRLPYGGTLLNGGYIG
jgi:hypothetical protein